MANHKISLKIQYQFFVLFIALVTAIAICIVSYLSYKEYDSDFNISITRQSQKIQLILHEKFAFMEHFLQFMGRKIVDSNNLRYDNISKVLRVYRNDLLDEVLSWNLINFIDAKGYLIADSKNGLQNSKYVEDIRDWLQYARKDPWHLKCSKPDQGLVTKDYLIPCGIAITDDNNKLLGYLSLGISVEKLLSSIMLLMNDELVVAFFDKSDRYVFSSDPFLDKAQFNSVITSKRQSDSLMLSDFFADEVQELVNKVKVGDYKFSHFVSMNHYPFWITSGYEIREYYKDLWYTLLPKAALTAFFGVLFAIILIYLSYKVVKPIITLGKIAERITENQSVHLPKFEYYEIALLGEKLANIAEVHKELQAKQTKLAKTNSELLKANEFIQSNMSFLSHELINPTSAIVEFAKTLNLTCEEKLNNDEQEILTFLKKASTHLLKQLDFFLKIFKFQAQRKKVEDVYINLKSLVDTHISMIMHHVKYKSLKIVVDIDPNLAIYGDEIMIGQLIQNIATNGAKYNKFEGELKVCGYMNKKHEVELSFSDTGHGIDKTELKKIFKLFNRAATNKNTSVGYGIGLTYAKACLDAHQAKIKVQSEPNVGSTFTITFPKSRTA